MDVTSHYCAHNMQHKFVTLSLTNDPNNDPRIKDDMVFNYAHNFSTSDYLDLPNNKTPKLLFGHFKDFKMICLAIMVNIMRLQTNIIPSFKLMLGAY